MVPASITYCGWSNLLAQVGVLEKPTNNGQWVISHHCESYCPRPYFVEWREWVTPGSSWQVTQRIELEERLPTGMSSLPPEGWAGESGFWTAVPTGGWSWVEYRSFPAPADEWELAGNGYQSGEYAVTDHRVGEEAKSPCREPLPTSMGDALARAIHDNPGMQWHPSIYEENYYYGEENS